MSNKSSEPIEPTFDTDAARKVLENAKIDKRNRGARKLQQFIDQLREEEGCIVLAVPVITQDGRIGAQLAVDALD